MANIQKYPRKDFSTQQTFLAYDPAQGTVRVSGQDIVDSIDLGTPIQLLQAEVNERVQYFRTTDLALLADLPISRVIYTTGASAENDGLGGHFVVVAAGTPDSIPMTNGNALLQLEFISQPVTYINSVADFAGFTGAVNDQQISLKGWRPDSDVGGGIFYWKADEVRTNHNGGTIISPARDLATEGLAAFLSEVVDADAGCWVRKGTNHIDLTWFGADITGLSDSSFILEKAESVAQGKKVVLSGDLLFSHPVTSARNLNILLKDETRILSDGATSWITDCPSLTIAAGANCEIGVTGNLFTSYILWWNNTSTVDNLYVGCNSGKLKFRGDTTTERLIGTETQTTGTSAIIENVIFDGFTRSGVELNLIASDLSGDLAKVAIDNCIAMNAGDFSGSRRAFQVGDNNSRSRSVSVTRCKVEGLGGSGNSEVKGILVYGEEVFIDNNDISNIRNTGGDDAEGIYVKALRCSITNNKLVNAGSSHDGVITLKGSPWESNVTYSGYSIVSNNYIELNDINYDIKGLGINVSHVVVTGNNLKDLRASRDTLDYSIAMGVGGSNFVTDIVISNNISDGWVDWMGSDSSDDKRARLIDKIIITGNVVTNLKGGNAMTWRNDAKVQRTATFDSGASTITLDVDAFDPNVHEVGETIVVSGSTANDGTYTISAITPSALTVSESLVDEGPTPNVSITIPQIGTMNVVNNIFHCITGPYAWRHRGGTFDLLSINNNQYINWSFVYRLDVGGSGTADQLFIGSGELYSNIATAVYNGNPTGSSVEYGLKTNIATGSNTTANGTIEVVDSRGNTRYLLTASSA